MIFLDPHRIVIGIVISPFLTSGLAQAQTSLFEHQVSLVKVLHFSPSASIQKVNVQNAAPSIYDPAPPVLSSTTGARVIIIRDYVPPGYPIPTPTIRTSRQISAAVDQVIVNGHYICTTELGDRIYSNHCGWPWPYDGGVGGSSGGNIGGGMGGGSHTTTPVKTVPSPVQSCQKALAKQDRTSKELVRKNEDFETEGYLLLPTDKFPNSGMTIGYGVDLGYRTESELKRWGMSAAGIKAVRPYLGLKGKKAAGELAKHPENPVISEADAIAISDGIYQDLLISTTNNYNDATSIGISFQELPAGAQAAIMDIAYMGKPSIKAPTFWSYVIKGEWSAAAGELSNWYGNGKTDARHLNDAKLIADAIKSGELPEKTSGKCQ
jgi:hypothetical protein